MNIAGRTEKAKEGEGVTSNEHFLQMRSRWVRVDSLYGVELIPPVAIDPNLLRGIIVDPAFGLPEAKGCRAEVGDIDPTDAAGEREADTRADGRGDQIVLGRWKEREGRMISIVGIVKALSVDQIRWAEHEGRLQREYRKGDVLCLVWTTMRS